MTPSRALQATHRENAFSGRTQQWKLVPALFLVRSHAAMVRPLPGHLALKDFNARKAVAGNPDPFLLSPEKCSFPLPANELLRRAYLYIVRNETIDSKVRGQAMLKLNAFPRAVSISLDLVLRPPKLILRHCTDSTDRREEQMHRNGSRRWSILRIRSLSGEYALSLFYVHRD